MSRTTAAAWIAAAFIAASPASSARADDVDAYLEAAMKERQIPGLAVAVVRDGRIEKAAGYGLASLELKLPVTTETIFPIASLDKQLTASGVMLLAQDGALALDDPVARFVPDAPRSWTGMSVRQLLSHSSGLPDVVASGFAGRWFTDYATEELLTTVRRQSLLAPPGYRHTYSDANFFLAQLVTEKAGRRDWRTFVRERLFAPAGMATATFMDAAPIVENRVAGHALDREGRLVSNRRYASDFGPLYNDVGASVLDFAHWAIALDGERVLRRSSLEQMWTPAHLADGRPATSFYYWRHYGFGWGLDRLRGRRLALHSGYTGVAIVKLLDAATSVVVFTNLDGRFSDALGLALGVAAHYVPDLALASLPPRPDPDPALGARLREEVERYAAGTSDFARYRPESVLPAWEGAAGGRLAGFGPLRAFEFLAEERLEGERILYYRAGFEKARVVFKISVDADGRIACLQALRV
jgi:CubicO group peptidase (beta-lactamase class C family)